MGLLQSIKLLKEENKYLHVNLFSYDALTENGAEIFDNYKVSLLCDADIIFLMKNLDTDSAKEYFQRKERRHPLWKSEAEYKAIFNVCYTDEKVYLFAAVCSYKINNSKRLYYSAGYL